MIVNNESTITAATTIASSQRPSHASIQSCRIHLQVRPFIAKPCSKPIHDSLLLLLLLYSYDDTAILRTIADVIADANLRALGMDKHNAPRQALLGVRLTPEQKADTCDLVYTCLCGYIICMRTILNQMLLYPYRMC